MIIYHTMIVKCLTFIFGNPPVRSSIMRAALTFAVNFTPAHSAWKAGSSAWLLSSFRCESVVIHESLPRVLVRRERRGGLQKANQRRWVTPESQSEHPQSQKFSKCRRHTNRAELSTVASVRAVGASLLSLKCDKLMRSS